MLKMWGISPSKSSCTMLLYILLYLQSTKLQSQIERPEFHGKCFILAPSFPASNENKNYRKKKRNGKRPVPCTKRSFVDVREIEMRLVLPIGKLTKLRADFKFTNSSQSVRVNFFIREFLYRLI